ncbi:hypothetical protein Tco_1444859 [Tanacetum coccineum]
MASLFPLIEELARSSGSDVVNDQLVVLFEREVVEDVGKIEEIRRLCIESCDDVLGTIEMLRHMQSDDTENVARLLSMARETRQRVDEINAFIMKIKSHGVV